MLYPDSFERKIKFDSLRELLSAQCESSMGRELMQSMSFSSERRVIEERLYDCSEFMAILQQEDFPGGVFADARPFLEKIRIEGLFLEVAEMVMLKGSLESLYSILRFFKSKREEYSRLANIMLSCSLYHLQKPHPHLRRVPRVCLPLHLSHE